MINDQPPSLRAEALASIADSPLTVEFRALALDSRSTVCRSGSGWLLMDGRRALVGALGGVSLDDAKTLHASAQPGCEVLADAEAHEVLRGEWTFVPARIAALERPWSRPACGERPPAVRPLLPRDSLDHLPDELRAEIEAQLEHRMVMAGFADDRPVSFASAPWVTEGFADLSIDTLLEYRRQGIGRTVVAALIEYLLEVGKTPVWGATVDNTASLAMAANLGITQSAGELYVYEP